MMKSSDCPMDRAGGASVKTVPMHCGAPGKRPVIGRLPMLLKLVFAAGLAAWAGCASQPAPLVPHITQADRPRLADTTPAMPPPPLEAVAARYQARLHALRTENEADPLTLDAYGGWANAPASLKAPNPDGYFRVAKLDGAWWFITPEGAPFVSKGVTDVNWLGATLAVDAFHDLMVEKYGAEDAWATAAAQRVRDWGFNTIGPWSSRSMTERLPHAYIILDMGGHAPRHPDALVTDYWDPAFAVHCAAMMDQRARPHIKDRRLIGYFLDNEVVWGADHFLTNKSLLRLYTEFPPDAPGWAEACALSARRPEPRTASMPHGIRTSAPGNSWRRCRPRPLMPLPTRRRR